MPPHLQGPLAGEKHAAARQSLVLGCARALHQLGGGCSEAALALVAGVLREQPRHSGALRLYCGMALAAGDVEDATKACLMLLMEQDKVCVCGGGGVSLPAAAEWSCCHLCPATSTTPSLSPSAPTTLDSIHFLHCPHDLITSCHSLPP